MKKYVLMMALAGSLFSLSLSAQKTIVAGKPTMQDRFPNKSGNILFSTLSLSFHGMLDNATATDTIRFYNAANYAISLAASNPASFIHAELSTTKLLPHTEGYVRIFYDATKTDDYGVLLHQLVINTSDSIFPKKEIFISTVVEPYFAPLSAADSALAPRLKVSETVYNFNKVKEGQPVDHTIQVTNTGKSELKITAVKPACSCLGAEIEKRNIAPGESTNLHLSYNTARKSGPESKDVTLYTNDPFMSKINITVKGEVIP